jgi:hypothetical protein
MRVATLVLLGLGGVAAVVACSPAPDSNACLGVECVPCPTPLTVNVANATDGGPVSSITVSGLDGFCQGSSCHLVSSNTGTPAGQYDFELLSPGFVPLTLREYVPPADLNGCCDCGYTATVVNVTLVPG